LLLSLQPALLTTGRAFPILLGAAFALASLWALASLALRGASRGETITTPGGAGTLTKAQLQLCNSLVLGAPASLIGSELSGNGAPAFIVLCPTPML
jgi:hypothetical protein